MARPDGEDLAEELQRLQARIEEIRQQLAEPPPEPKPPPAAERAAKRWGLGVAAHLVGGALWAASRPRALSVAALGTATVATGVTSGVLLLPDTHPLPQGQDPPAVIETTTAPRTVTMTTQGATTTTAPSNPVDGTTEAEVTSPPAVQAAPNTTAPQTTPQAREPTTAAPTTAPTTTRNNGPPARQNPPPANERSDPPSQQPANGNEGRSDDNRQGGKSGKAQPECKGIHVDVPKVAEVCLLG